MNTPMKKRLAVLGLTLVLLLGLTTTVLAAPAKFQDVPSGHWAAEEIARAVETGMFNGRSDGSFGLGKPMTRSAFVTALERLFDWEPVRPALPSFTDVAVKERYYAAVETALANGAVTQQDGRFRPGEAITREEMAVMLVRALGCDGLAGLAQELPLPFQDLTTNPGYIAVAYDLGLMNGYSATSFAPSQTATREQAAVVLVRLYEKHHGDGPAVSTLVGAAGLTVEKPLADISVAAGLLLPSGKEARIATVLSEESQAAARQAAKTAGIPALLQVMGTDRVLGLPTGALCTLLGEAVETGSWDGLHLDIAQVGQGNRAQLSALAKALDQTLGDKTLVLTVEAPAWKGTKWGGYDLATLGQAADRLVLRVGGYEEEANGFPVAPPEPLEEVYYALCTAAGKVDAKKLSLQLTTTGSAWSGQGSRLGTRRAAEIDALLKGGAIAYDSGRYGSAYLVSGQKGSQEVVWYQSGESVTTRLQMAALLGVEQVTLSDGGSVAEYEGYSLTGALWP